MVEAICSYKKNKDEDFYCLLGCDESSSVEQIETEFKRRAIREHPDKNPDDKTAGECFQKLQKAREVLTDTAKRSDYDKWRRSGMAISYKQWCGLSDSVRTTMHWATKAQTKPMIQPSNAEKHPAAEAAAGEEVRSKVPRRGNDSTNYVVGNVVWHREKGNDLLRKFRNYEI